MRCISCAPGRAGSAGSHVSASRATLSRAPMPPRRIHIHVKAASSSGSDTDWNPFKLFRRTLSLGRTSAPGSAASGTNAPRATASSSVSSDAPSSPPNSPGDGSAAAATAEAAPTPAKSDAYTQDMQHRMGTSLTYRHEAGINWNTVVPDLVVGSCLQTPKDADLLAESGITTVLCLQEDCDLEYFSIDIAGIRKRCEEVGINHVRFPIRDFDPYDLRLKLPKAVAKLAAAHNPRHGRVYIHCTAGLGRAPATALAYMYWLRGWELEEARLALTGVRPCSPRIESIRAATADLLAGGDTIDTVISTPNRGAHKTIEVAGLDFGWHKRVKLEENPVTHRMETTRQLMPGSYSFKFVIDDKWTMSADYPTVSDGANTNNILTVLPRNATQQAQRERLLAKDGKLMDEERMQLGSMLCPWETHDPKMHRSLSSDDDDLPPPGA